MSCGHSEECVRRRICIDAFGVLGRNKGVYVRRTRYASSVVVQRNCGQSTSITPLNRFGNALMGTAQSLMRNRLYERFDNMHVSERVTATTSFIGGPQDPSR